MSRRACSILWARRETQRQLRLQLPHGPPTRRARRALRAAHARRLGPAWQPAHAAPHPVQRHRPAQRRAGKGSRNRGLLDDTLVIWRQVGRTPSCRATSTIPKPMAMIVIRVPSQWLAGGGVKKGCIYGSSDDFAYHAAETPCMCMTCKPHCCISVASSTSASLPPPRPRVPPHRRGTMQGGEGPIDVSWQSGFGFGRIRIIERALSCGHFSFIHETPTIVACFVLCLIALWLTQTLFRQREKVRIQSLDSDRRLDRPAQRPKPKSLQ